MRKAKWFLLTVIVALCCWQCLKDEPSDDPDDDLPSDALIIDHACTDWSKIPDEWLAKARENFRVHNAWATYGSQIIIGLDRLAPIDGKYAVSRKNCELPTEANALNMIIGQGETADCQVTVTPDLYWESDAGLDFTRQLLIRSTANVSMWVWDSELDSYSQSQVQDYLDKISQLESEFPGVTFVYLTGNSQEMSANRTARNQQIRDYCRANDKVLFDFGDMDCWFNNIQYVVDGIPMQHPRYSGNEAVFTTFENCDKKAIAFWWLLARLAGWDGQTT